MTSPLRWAIVIADLAGMATVCPISARLPRYPGEVPLPRGMAGQTEDAVVLCHQLRTVDLTRVRSYEVGGMPQRVEDPTIRGQVRAAIAHHLGLDIRTPLDGAA